MIVLICASNPSIVTMRSFSIQATRIMNRIAQWPEGIRSYFQHPHSA